MNEVKFTYIPSSHIIIENVNYTPDSVSYTKVYTTVFSGEESKQITREFELFVICYKRCIW